MDLTRALSHRRLVCLRKRMRSFFVQCLNRVIGRGVAFAHCDIPCGIYTTEQAITAARTVQVMVEKIQQAPREDTHAIARYTATKEQWAQICKDELLILWADFFKDEHLQDHPNIHSVLWKAVKLCSSNKREVNAELATSLCEAVGEVDALFQTVQGS